MDFMVEAIYEKRTPIVSMRTNIPRDENLYALFSQKCDRKEQMMQILADAYHQKFPNGARLTVTKDLVQTSVDTIKHSGVFWTDGSPVEEKKKEQ